METELTRPNDPFRDLKSEDFSAKLDADPNKTVNPTVRPLNTELAAPIESVSDLKRELFSVKLADEPIAPLRLSARPFS